MMDVVVYTTPTCPWSKQVKEFFQKKPVLFTEHNVLADPVAATQAYTASKQRGVPITIIKNEKTHVLVGYNPAALEAVL